MSTPTLSVGPAKLNLKLRQGSTFAPAPLTYTYDEAGLVPIDLTGYTARMQIRDVDSNALLHSLTTEDGGLTLGGAAGTIALSISATDTAAFEWTTGKYDLELVAPSGFVTSLLAGSVVVTAEVTV